MIGTFFMLIGIRLRNIDSVFLPKYWKDVYVAAGLQAMISSWSPAAVGSCLIVL